MIYRVTEKKKESEILARKPKEKSGLRETWDQSMGEMAAGDVPEAIVGLLGKSIPSLKKRTRPAVKGKEFTGSLAVVQRKEGKEEVEGREE